MNSSSHEKHQSKIFALSDAIKEYNVITKTVAPILKKLPFYNRKLFIFDAEMNKLKAIDAHNLDTTLHDTKISNMMILRFNNGCGIDIKQYVKKSMDINAFKNLNLNLITLLKYGIVAMNDQQLYHMNIKADNIVIDCDSNIVKLADWDKSNKIDSSYFPYDYNYDVKSLPYNIPFVSILMGVKNINAFGDIEWGKFIDDVLKTDAFIIPIIMDIYQITKLQAKKYLMNYFLSVMYFIKLKKTNISFINKTYIQNIDIWGFIMVYYTFLKKVNNTVDINIRNIFKKYIYALKYVYQKIPVDELCNDLQNIHLLQDLKHFENKIEIFKTPENKIFETPENKPSKFTIKKQKLKRCPNGSRRSKIDKQCHTLKK